MKIAIIYSTSSITTKKSCEILSNKIKSDVQLIPIEKAKSECLLKYNFIILAGLVYKDKVQGTLKRYIYNNLKTLKEKPIGLVLNCEEEIEINERLIKTFGEELVKSSYITSNFGYELNSNEGNFIEKRKIKSLINKYEKNGKKLPTLNLNEINNFADFINNMIDKRVD